MDRNELLKMLVCPWCLGGLRAEGQELHCGSCRAIYRIEAGIPNMLVKEATLYCPICAEELVKPEGDVALCRRCDRGFDMTKRLKTDG